MTEFGLGNPGADGHLMVSTPVHRSGYLWDVVNLKWLTQGLSGGAMPTIGADAVELAKA
ncbi:MAG: hypothetical protein M1415_05135 [Firmicutes bacterium]|nr:hypothetical protein [Bacillota bacterium]MCL5063471.1 hypothetical protein [Bacillota bacterium]